MTTGPDLEGRMTAQATTTRDSSDPLVVAQDPVEVARAHLMENALTDSQVGQVGLELEFHVVDLADPARRPSWIALNEAAAQLPVMPAGSSVSFEPGGQIELSTPPKADLVSAVAALRSDRVVLRRALRELGLGAAPLGADPARRIQRVNPAGRYAAMERHFDALGCGEPGRAMMSGTAALQVNLDAGPEAGWADRMALIGSLVPVLIAASASSPYLGARESGWHSMRQQTWHGIDLSRTGPVGSGEPTSAWATYALDARVMLTRDGDEFRSVTERLSFGDWLRGAPVADRPPTLRDLDYHLTTLFPPVRPRGYVEIRCADALPDRWWPALAALVVLLIDDPAAADRAAEASLPVAELGDVAARRGMSDPRIRTAVEECIAIAVEHAPEGLTPDLVDLAELVASGLTPGAVLRERARSRGPLRLLEEEAHA
jgi:glutamate--cysteine ligase